MIEIDKIVIEEPDNAKVFQHKMNAEAYAHELRARFPSASFEVKEYGAFFAVFTCAGVFFGGE